MTMKRVTLCNEQGEKWQEHTEEDIPGAACAAGEAMIVVVGEGPRKDGGGGKSILSPPPPPLVLEQHQQSKDYDKQEQQQHNGDLLSPLAVMPSGRDGDAQHLASSGAGGPKPRMLRFFIMFSITWSAAITSCLGPYFPLVKSKKKGGREGEWQKRGTLIGQKWRVERQHSFLIPPHPPSPPFPSPPSTPPQYVKQKFGVSSMLIGVIFSITSIVQFVTCPMVSPLSRTFSRLATLRVGLVVLAVGTLLFGLLDSIPGFVLGRLLQGIGNGFLEVSGLSLLMRFSTDLRRDIGLLEGASSVGYLLGPLIGGFLSARLGFRELFVLMALPVLGLVVLLWARPSWVLPPEESSEGPTWEGSDEDEDAEEELGEEEEGYEPMKDDDLVEVELEMAPHVSTATAVTATTATAGSTSVRQRPARMPRTSSSLPPPTPTPLPPALTPYESFASTTRKLLRALAASPTLPLYIAIVLVAAGGLSFMDTALAEHLVMATGVSTYTAGLLFTLQVGTFKGREGGNKRGI
jgi:MFS family permease